MTNELDASDPTPHGRSGRPRRYILFNKPFGVLSTYGDAEGRSSLAAYIPPPDIHPAGQLDRDSEGLLFLTDDGDLAHRLSHPRHKLPKTYIVQVEGTPDEESLAQLRSGVPVKGEMTLPAEAEYLRAAPDLPPRSTPVRDQPGQPTGWLRIVLREGKKRQIRHMTAAVGHPTLRLMRVAIGPLTLNGLAPGQWRELAPDEIRNLWQAVGGRAAAQVGSGTPPQTRRPGGATEKPAQASRRQRLRMPQRGTPGAGGQPQERSPSRRRRWPGS
jgi:23S rRNA pseudouridine2457 synthase